MNIEMIKEFINDKNIELHLDVPLREHTSFKIGGPAKVFLLPKNLEGIKSSMEICKRYDEKPYILGNGSNVLFHDDGFDGVVIKIADNYSNVEMEGAVLRTSAGALLSTVAKGACRKGLTGFEFATGIPGTIGGAVIMNAGAYGGEMKDIVREVTLLDKEGNIVVLKGSDMEFGYRTSRAATEEMVVLEAVIELEESDYDSVMETVRDLTQRRTSKQPLHLPSAGSTFKRPPGHYAGKLIQDAGLKGLKYGGAQVSEKHSGFVVSVDNATSEDVRTLIKLVQKRVYELMGVELETEIKIIGK